MTLSSNNDIPLQCRPARRRLIHLLALLVVMSQFSPASMAAVECKLGQPSAALIGDGVMLYSCSWEHKPGEFVRTGPLQLVRNGILILSLHTDREGRLQGAYSSWDDDGKLTEQGQYIDGLKQGEWQETNADGKRQRVFYRDGIAVLP